MESVKAVISACVGKKKIPANIKIKHYKVYIIIVKMASLRVVINMLIVN